MDNITKLKTKMRGCKCKNTGCLKMYCHCIKAGVLCGPRCKCTGCENCSMNPERTKAIIIYKNKKLFKYLKQKKEK